MFEDQIYMDNSASTRLDERVLDAMRPFLFDIYAVATSEFGYSHGVEAREALNEARASIGRRMNASEEEFIFTSGSTESSNIAVKGAVYGSRSKGNHFIVSSLEDFPVLNSAKALEKEGFEVTFLDVDGDGKVDLNDLANAVRDDTTLVSIQQANQEIGTLQDLKAVSEICRDRDVLLHTDATHGFPRIPLDTSVVDVDLATVSAHTIHGPKGIGGLYVRKGTPMSKWMDGGFQEFNMRAGIENIPGAVGLAKAVELVTEEETDRIRSIRDRIIDEGLKIDDTTLNGHRTERSPQNANITFHFVEGEALTLHLDMRGFAVSTGSACFSRSLEASHVIMGIGGDHERAHGSVRFTLGRFNKMADADTVVETVAEVVARLREISPLARKDCEVK